MICHCTVRPVNMSVTHVFNMLNAQQHLRAGWSCRWPRCCPTTNRWLGWWADPRIRSGPFHDLSSIIHSINVIKHIYIYIKSIDHLVYIYIVNIKDYILYIYTRWSIDCSGFLANPIPIELPMQDKSAVSGDAGLPSVVKVWEWISCFNMHGWIEGILCA